MKKIYKASRLLFLFLIVANCKVQAQASCPTGPNVSVTHSQLFTPTGLHFVVFITGFTPNAHYSLFTKTGTTPFITTLTDANGSGMLDYTATGIQPADLGDLTVCTDVTSCQICHIPLISACTVGAVSNVKYTDAPITCCVYVRATNAGETVRIYDASGNQIAFSIDPLRQSGDLVCLVYDCNLVPTSLTICGPTGCCSSPIAAQGALPVHLTSYSVNSIAYKQAKIDWSTDREEGSKLFVVEKSTNGADFNAIGQYAAAGNTLQRHSYTHIDDVSGAAYYRLKMVDIDGKFEYSKVLYINNGRTTGAVTQILPNPTVNGSFQLIGISTADLNSKTVHIYNVSGAQVQYSITGANAISLGNVPSGIYVVKVKDQTLKLMKQ